MHLNFHINEDIKRIFDDIINHHGQVYITGGAIRDAIMGYTIKDIDVEVYHLTGDEIQHLLSKYGEVLKIGKAFSIYKIDKYPHVEFALPRIEVKTGETHKDFDVESDPFLDEKTAALRRDFTMNALMYDYEKDILLDHFHGLEDIHTKTLRLIDEKRFQEDPLRILRAASFISRFDVVPDETLIEVCTRMVKEGALTHLSLERIEAEYEKILLSPRPSLGMNFLKEIGGLPSYLSDLIDCFQRLDFHPEGDVWNHTMLVVDLAGLVKEETSNPLGFMWAALLHDIGKPLVTTPEGHAPKHNEAGVVIFQRDVHMIKSKKLRKYIEKMIFYHMHLLNMMRHQTGKKRYIQILKDIEGICTIEDLRWITICDKMGRGYIASKQIGALNDYVDYMIDSYGSVPPDPVVTGKDLYDYSINHKEYTYYLNYAYNLQLEGYDKEEILRRIENESR